MYLVDRPNYTIDSWNLSKSGRRKKSTYITTTTKDYSTKYGGL